MPSRDNAEQKEGHRKREGQVARLCDDTWAGEGAGLGLLDVAGPSTVEEKAQIS